MSGHIFMVFWVIKILFCIVLLCVFCHLFLVSSASVRSIPFLYFILAIFAWYVPLVSLIFLKRSRFSPRLLFSSISLLDHLGRLSYLCLLFFGTLHSDGCIFPFLLCLSLLFFSVICKASSDSYFAFLHFFFFGMVLVTTSCTMLWTLSIVLQPLCLQELIPWIYSSPSLCNHKGFDLGHTWMV